MIHALANQRVLQIDLGLAVKVQSDVPVLSDLHGTFEFQAYTDAVLLGLLDSFLGHAYGHLTFN